MKYLSILFKPELLQKVEIIPAGDYRIGRSWRLSYNSRAKCVVKACFKKKPGPMTVEPLFFTFDQLLFPDIRSIAEGVRGKM